MSRQLSAAPFTPAYFFNDEHRPTTYDVVWEAARSEDGRMREWQAVIRTEGHLLYGWYDLSDSNRVNWSSTADGRQAPTGEGWQSFSDGHHIIQDGICATCNTIPCRSL
jgi:hypothetical protein